MPGITTSMRIRSGFISRANEMHSEPSAAETVSKPCFSRAVFITWTSVGESSTIMISAIVHPPGELSAPYVTRDRSEKLVLRERLRQVLLGADQPAARAVEKPVLARQHDDRRVLELLVVLDQGACLVAVETRHHDVDEDDIRVMVRDLRERVEPVHGRIDRTTFFG